MKEAALDYIHHGFSIIPLHYPTAGGSCFCGRADCPSTGKHPLTQNGIKDAFSGPELVSFWWDKHPDANIGIATGNGLVVLDMDGADGRESLSALLSEFGFTELPETWAALTGGGGVHYLFRCSDLSIRNRAGIRPSIDVRAKGGYIVAPPSLHRSGERYQWEPFHSPYDVPIAELPEWLHVLLSQPAAPPQKSPTP